VSVLRGGLSDAQSLRATVVKGSNTDMSNSPATSSGVVGESHNPFSDNPLEVALARGV